MNSWPTWPVYFDFHQRPHDRRIIDLLFVVQLGAAGIAGRVHVGDVLGVLPDAANHVAVHDLHMVNVEQQFQARRTDLLEDFACSNRCDRPGSRDGPSSSRRRGC